MERIAFLGTGLLGGAMVERMLAQGQSVTVWNRTASKLEALRTAGAAVAATARDAVACENAGPCGQTREGGRAVPARAGLHVAADVPRRQGPHHGVRAGRDVRRRSAGAGADDRGRLVSWRTERAGRR